MGAYIIPTDAEMLSNFEAGLSASKNATRRVARGSRRLQQRYKLRRHRLLEVLKALNWIPDDYTLGQKLPVFPNSIKEMYEIFGTDKVSEDWIVYYLRHKALTQKVELSELARILYHMNQRRGFKSNRKANNESTSSEETEDNKKRREKKIEIVYVSKIEDTGEQIKGNTLFHVFLQDGRMGSILRKNKPEWKGEMELEITYIPPTKKDPERFEFRIPDKTDWLKSKEALEKDISEKDLFTGEYFFKELLKNPHYRVKERIIDRKYYLAEINEIFRTQFKFHPEIENHAAINQIAEIFYPRNFNKQREIKNNSLAHLFINDIIYFQRPLKSQKSSIAECRYEKKNFRRPDGKLQAIKVAPTSSPSFQEFRIWQTINNIRVLQREFRTPEGNLLLDHDVNDQFMTENILENLYELFDNREKVTQKQILKEMGIPDEEKHLINLFRQDEQKELPGNETKAAIRRALKRAGLNENEIRNIVQSPNTYYRLWHLLYSLDQHEHIAKALQKAPFQVSADAAEVMSKAPTFKQQYAALSSKSINRLLPLMRSGKYWNEKDIDNSTRDRIEKILTGEYDEGISAHTRDLFEKRNASKISDFSGLQTAMAAYAVYGIHSERDKVYYDTPEQIPIVGQHELRNPIVTQVLNETLKTVQDIWRIHGRPYEIHIELARELKKNAKERAELSKVMAENKKENDRISAILRELNWGNPNSLGDIEKLKLWERQADESARESFKDIRFKRPSEPTKEEIQKYKLWCGQKHISPYSGEIIPVSELFTSKYQVDHIIPRARYFDDSFENKVVVESFLNDEKDKRTAYQYIKNGSEKGYKLLSLANYESLVNRIFTRKKKRLLLSEEIPVGFIERQLNDTKYITRKLNELLSPIAEHQQSPIVVTNGTITNELKTRWGISEKMKEVVKWRFERLQNEKTETELVCYVDELKNGKPTGKRLLKLIGYEKRIDHRHHALDALTVACTTRSHIKYLNTLNAQQNDTALKESLSFLLEQAERGKTGIYKFRQPWKGFVNDTENALNSIIISFKNKVRLLGKKTNRYIRYVQTSSGNWEKKWNEQKEKKSTYVRQSLHKATFSGKIELRDYKAVSIDEALKSIDEIADKKLKNYIKEISNQFGNDATKIKKHLKTTPLIDKNGNQIKKIEVAIKKQYYVNRVSLDASFDEKKINKIPDNSLRAALKNHLDSYNNNSKEAFSAEGIEAFNRNRNFPVRKVRIMEEASSKFEISSGKWVESDKGTNLFFAIYEKHDEPGKREYASIPLKDVIKSKTEGDGIFVEEKPGYKYFLLSPNDLVYMPDENENIKAIDWQNDRGKIASKIYKLVSVNKAQAFFIPHTVSKVIIDKTEFDSGNKVERALDGRMIKQHCIKLKVNRLGHIKPA